MKKTLDQRSSSGNLTIILVYTVPPDERYGTGGVRQFLTRFTGYLDSVDIGWRYETLARKPMRNQIASPLVHLARSLITALRIVHSKNRDSKPLIYAHDAAYSGLAAVMASKLVRFPCLVHCHNLPSALFIAKEGSDSILSNMYLGFLRLVERIVLRGCDAVIVTNPWLSQAVIKRYGTCNDRVITIPTGADVSEIWKESRRPRSASNEFDNRASEFTVGYVGRLSQVKNLKVLLKGFSLFLENSCAEGAHLILVGEGPERASLEESARTLGIRNQTTFTGYRTEAANLLGLFDVFVLPSVSEGAPLALLEAMAAELSIIASRIPANTSILTHGVDALLFDAASPEELALLLSQLFGNTTLRKELAGCARRTVKKYDYQRVLHDILQVGFDLLDERLAP